MNIFGHVVRGKRVFVIVQIDIGRYVYIYENNQPAFSIVGHQINLSKTLPPFFPLDRLLRLHPQRQTPLPPPLPLVPLLLHDRALPADRPPPATTGRAHDDPLAPRHRGRVLAPEVDIAVFILLFFFFFLFTFFIIIMANIMSRPPHPHAADPIVDPAARGPAAAEPVGVVHAAFAQDADLHGDAELDVADHAVPAAVLARAAAAGAQAELAQKDRVPPFEDLSVGDARVGHVRVHARGAVPGGAGAGAAGYCFVVAEAFCWGGGGRIVWVGVGIVAAEAESQVVAVALGGGASGEGEEDDVRDAL